MRCNIEDLRLARVIDTVDTRDIINKIDIVVNNKT